MEKSPINLSARISSLPSCCKTAANKISAEFTGSAMAVQWGSGGTTGGLFHRRPMSRRPLIAHRYPTAIVWRRTRETFDLELRQKAPQSLWCINTDWRFPPPFPLHALCTCTRHYTPCLCSAEVRVAGRTRPPRVTFSLCACEFQPTCAFPQNVNAAVTCGELVNGQAKRGMGKQTNKKKKQSTVTLEPLKGKRRMMPNCQRRLSGGALPVESPAWAAKIVAAFPHEYVFASELAGQARATGLTSAEVGRAGGQVENRSYTSGEVAWNARSRCRHQNTITAN